MALLETLKAANDRATAEDDPVGREIILEEWKNSISYLYDNIESWLQSYIEKKLVTVYREQGEVNESPFGAYKVVTLRIKAGNQFIILHPIGRLTASSAGRVDMWREGKSTARERYRLIRAENDEKSIWLIHLSNKLLANGRRFDGEVLGQYYFEEMLENLLRS